MITTETLPTAPPNAKLLKNWLNERGISPERFAGQVGVSKPAVYNWLSGELRPTKAIHQQKIDKLTDGAIRPLGWQTDEERAELAALKPLRTGTEG